MKCEEDVMMGYIALTKLEKLLLERIGISDEDIEFGHIKGNENKYVKASAWDKLKTSKMDGYRIKVVNARHNPESNALKSIADREHEELLYMDYLDGTNEARDLIKETYAKVDVEG